MTAWRVKVPEAEEPTRLLGPAAATLEPKHRFKGTQKMGGLHQRAVRRAQARATGATALSVRTRQGPLLSQAEKDQAAEDKSADIEEDLSRVRGAGQSHGK